MLILDMNKIQENVANKYDKDKILNDMSNTNTLSNFKIVSGDGLIFIITNQNCAINGFGRRCELASIWIESYLP